MTKKQHQDDQDDLQEASMEALRQVTEQFTEKHAEEQLRNLNQTIKNATGDPTGIGAGSAPSDSIPDEPPCDLCGKAFSGRYACSKCSLAFYCSAECQTIHWKREHKQKCKLMKQRCHDDASRLVDLLSSPSADTTPMAISARFNNSVWEGVDEAGPYKIAMQLGLHSVIQDLMRDEIQSAQERFHSNILASYVQQLMCVLFRSGRCFDSTAFSHVDPYRIRKYVKSAPEAFELWFEASMTIVGIFISHGMERYKLGDEGYFWNVQRITRGIVSAWTLVWTSKEASRAILRNVALSEEEQEQERHANRNTDGEAMVGAARVRRAKWIINQLKRILNKFWDVDVPDNGAVEAHLNTFTAIIEIRLAEFGVDIGEDFIKLLGLKGMRKMMYLDMAVPFAEGTIKKGRALTTLESQAIMREHARSGGNRNKAASGTSLGAKKKKKKGKRNQRLLNK